MTIISKLLKRKLSDYSAGDYVRIKCKDEHNGALYRVREVCDEYKSHTMSFTNPYTLAPVDNFKVTNISDISFVSAAQAKEEMEAKPASKAFKIHNIVVFRNDETKKPYIVKAIGDEKAGIKLVDYATEKEKEKRVEKALELRFATEEEKAPAAEVRQERRHALGLVGMATTGEDVRKPEGEKIAPLPSAEPKSQVPEAPTEPVLSQAFRHINPDTPFTLEGFTAAADALTEEIRKLRESVVGLNERDQEILKLQAQTLEEVSNLNRAVGFGLKNGVLKDAWTAWKAKEELSPEQESAIALIQRMDQALQRVREYSQEVNALIENSQTDAAPAAV